MNIALLVCASGAALFAVICLLGYLVRMNTHRNLENKWWDILSESPTKIKEAEDQKLIVEAATLKKPLLHSLLLLIISSALTAASFGIISPIGISSVALGIALVSFLLSSIRMVWSKPVFMGVQTHWRRPFRLCKPIRPGFVWLPGWFFGWHNVITVNCETIDDEKKFTFVAKVRTPDKGWVSFPVGLTLEVDTENLYTFIWRGGVDKLSSILRGITMQVVREWAGSSDYGPQTAEEALFAQEEVVLVLVKKIAGKQIDRIPSIVPTPILRKMFAPFPRPQTDQEIEQFGEDWTMAWAQIRDHEDEAEIRLVLTKRDEQIEEVKAGNGGIRLTKWGVKLSRLTAEDAQIEGQLAEAIANEAVEEYEARGELREMKGVNERVALLVKHAKDELDIKLDISAAFRIVEIQQGKTSRTYLDLGLPGEDVLKGLLAFLGRGK